jgi:dipeptidyl aminopeptidase/acylaminoacyl peptidase
MVAALAGITIGTTIVAVLATENAFHIRSRPRPAKEVSDALARQTGATCSGAQVRTADGVILDAWLFLPPKPNGSGVILLHGVGDTRRGMYEHARFLLHNGFTVLTPDVRGHGSSGGDITTYGIREAHDVRNWADWLLRNHFIDSLYGLGQSMGAAILIQAARSEPRLRAIVADCSFASFEEIAFDRFTQASSLPAAAFWPVIRMGFLYGRLRDGVDLRLASPVKALHKTTAPTLLIHGIRDSNIPIRHSRELYAANRGVMQL